MSRQFDAIAPVELHDPLHARILDGDVPRLLLASSPLPSYVSTDADSGAEPGVGETNLLDAENVHNEDGQDGPPCSTPYGTPLQLAACLGNLAAVNALLDAGADPAWAVENHNLLPPEIPDYERNCIKPIHLATFYGHRSVVARLWARSTIPPFAMRRDEEISSSVWNEPDERWILRLAAHLGEVSIVQDLLFSEVQFRQIHLEGALEAAVDRWDPHVATTLLEHEPTVYSHVALNRALDRACSHKSTEHPWSVECGLYAGMEYANQSALIARLIEAGANPNSMGYGGKPLITTAASLADMTGALRALLKGGADPNLKDEDFGLTALSTAVVTVMHTLADPAFETIRYVWNETALRLLLNHGASATARSFNGTTPLHVAARLSNLRFFNLIAESLTTAQLQELKNDFGETLLHFACLGGQLDIIEMLLDRGFDVNQKSALGWTPFLCALTPDARFHIDREGDWKWKGPSEAVQAAHFLIARGADTRAVSDHGWTPLHILRLHEDPSTACHNGVHSLGLKLFEADRTIINAP